MKESMPLPIRADVHLHTLHSHGKASPLTMYRTARELGLDIIGFSEHSLRPSGYTYPEEEFLEHLAASFPCYIEEVLALKAQAANENAEVLLGLELDYIPDEEPFGKKLVDEWPYDYIIGGIHFQGTWGFDLTAEDWKRYSEQELFSIYSRYFSDLERMCSTGLVQIAAHPDLVKVFTKDSFYRWLDSASACVKIEKALIAMKENAMAMEISSAGLCKPCAEIYPCPLIMEMAKELGLSISFASDAHCTNTPAMHFQQLACYAASFGWKESVIFRKKKSVTLPFAVTH